MSIKGQFLRRGAACEGEPKGNPSGAARQLPPSHRPSSLSCAGVAHGLFSEKSIPCSFLQNAHASGSLREPYGYRGAEGKPLRRCAPAPPFAPKRPFGTFRCCAWLILRFRTDPPSVRRCSARLIRQAETLELQPLRGLHQAILCSFLQNAHASGSLRSPYGYRGARATPQALRASFPLRTETPLRDVPVLRSAYFHKEYTVLFAPKRSTFRFAALTLRVQGSQGSPSGGAAEGKTPAQEIAARALEAGNRDLYCIGGMSPCSVRAALRSWWRRAYSS